MMNDQMNSPTGRTKRDFLKYVLGGSLFAWLSAVLYPVLAYMKPPKQGEVLVSSVNAGKLADLANDTGKIIKFGTKPVILVRTAGGELKAFDATCTHLDCTVQYRGDMGVIWCACHNGKYDMNGRNIAGPPPKPLEPYRVVVQNDEIIISKNA